MDLNWDETRQQIKLAMLRDQHWLRREWNRLSDVNSASDDSISEKRIRWLARLEKSLELSTWRKANVPNGSDDGSLPIHGKADEIIEAIRGHSVVVVCGETGSGKSTQLPKLCLRAGRGILGLIGHTQPRRIAARSISERLASELSSPLGEAVGYKIRFTDKTSDKTFVKLMTDGILLAETQNDRFLDQYDTLILDEAHERSLNIDFLIGYLTRLLQKRHDFRLVITSATIDVERFAEHFSQAVGPVPMIHVSGRTYPVEVRYRPIQDEDVDFESEKDLFDSVADAIAELRSEGEGDILVFLPTESDILAAAKRLKGRFLHDNRTEILPLYARLSTSDQQRIFSGSTGRRIVLATNVAESSLTVPGIRYVVDVGTARISRYSPRSKVQRLPIEAISQASADQRKGRCGRLGPGICVRLYSEEDYLQRERFTTPEIRRTNLASVVLQTESLKLGSIEDFPFIDPPRPEAVRDGYKTLFELGAVDEDRQLTETGRRLSRLPVDPCVGRMLLEADRNGCLADISIIAAALEIQDVRERPVDKQQAADEQHAKFLHPESDFLSLLKIWDFYHQLKESISGSKLRKACLTNFLSFNRLREWSDLHRQLLSVCHDAGLKVHARLGDYESIHRALLSGLLSGVGMKNEKHEYTGAGGSKFFLWPGSGIFGSKPQWVMASEIVETTRRYGRTVAKIQPEWIEPLAKHLVSHSYSEPHWSEKNEQCMAYEKVSLYGLPVVPRRRVSYVKIDREISRKTLIEHGLTPFKMQRRYEFLQWNRAVLDEIESLRARTRDRSYVVDESQIDSFYEERLPEEVVDGPTLLRALQKDRTLNEKLQFTPQDLLQNFSQDLNRQAFPDQLEAGPGKLKLDYYFEPGSDNDGISLKVPREAIGQLNVRQLGWLVPGLLEQRVVSVIRNLPKEVRRCLIPAPDVAKKAVTQLKFGEGDFAESLAEVLSKLAGQKIPKEYIELDKLEPHLRINVQVVDDAGKVVASGRDVRELQEELGVSSTSMSQIHDHNWNRQGLKNWDFGDLPEFVSIKRNGLDIKAFPALFDDQTSLSLRLVDQKGVAETITRQGLTRLASWTAQKEIRTQLRWLPKIEQIKIWALGRIPVDQWETQLSMLMAKVGFVESEPLPRTQPDWEARFVNKVERASVAAQEISGLLPKIFENYQKVKGILEGGKSSAHAIVAGQVKSQLEWMMPADFLVSTPWNWLKQIPRYLQAILSRWEKVASFGPKDQEFQKDVQRHIQRYEERLKSGYLDERQQVELTTYRWMIEEYRVSLWAQQLGTSTKISGPRLDKQFELTK